MSRRLPKRKRASASAYASLKIAPRRTKARPTLLITNSMRRTFQQCRRKFWYSYEKLLVSKMPYLPFVIGGEFHDAMELFYLKRPEAEILRRVDKNMVAYQAQLLPPHLLDKLAVAHGALRGMLEAYFVKYASDREKWEIVDVERVFDASTQADGWRKGGKNDLVIRDQKGKLGIVEHKTTGDLSVSYVERIPLDDQIHQYVSAAEEDFGKVDFVLYNVVMKSRLRQKQGEDFEQFVRRVEEQYHDEPAKYFYRERLKLPRWSLKRFERELAVVAKEIERAREVGEEAFYMNTSQCYAYGKCPYVELCSTPKPADFEHLYAVGKTPHPELEEEFN